MIPLRRTRFLEDGTQDEARNGIWLGTLTEWAIHVETTSDFFRSRARGVRMPKEIHDSLELPITKTVTSTPHLRPSLAKPTHAHTRAQSHTCRWHSQDGEHPLPPREKKGETKPEGQIRYRRENRPTRYNVQAENHTCSLPPSSRSHPSHSSSPQFCFSARRAKNEKRKAKPGTAKRGRSPVCLCKTGEDLAGRQSEELPPENGRKIEAG